jgi:hypothetical protein
MDPLTVEWFVNGTKVQEASDYYVFDANFTSSGTYNVTVKVADDTDYVAHTWFLTVSNVERELAITAIASPKTLLVLGSTTTVNVTVENHGAYDETFNLVLYTNATVIDTSSVSLAAGNSTLVIFTWNTTDYGYGRHIISAHVAPVPGETNTTDNTLTLGTIRVSILGDIDGDFDVDILDVVTVTIIYGSRRGDPVYKPAADLNNDGVINIFDVVTCTRNYGLKVA